MDVSPWIQWPVLAAFLAVIFFLGKYFVEKAQKDAEHDREKEKQAAEFIQQLAQDGIAAYKAHIEATRAQSTKIEKIVEDNSRAWNRDAEAMYALTRAIEQRNRQAAEDHAAMQAQLRAMMAVTEK